ncbi:MAG: DegT/DnrJ/EryC1/StrS family aminotransferase [Anaerolineaceae bacterium]|nr:DegT/DnrJ/EryC1/StrS family aminotransferase [Anaerolineaceae bacterium]
MAKNKYLVPMSSPDISQSDRNAVLETLKTNYLSMGPKIQAFEQSFRIFTGAKHAIGVSSGTAGLHLCIRAAEISNGDIVITTPFSFVSSTNVILFERAIPVFVDVEPDTGNIDPEKARQAVLDIQSNDPHKASKWLPRSGAHSARAVKAILSVDVFGQPADYDTLEAIAKENQLTLIEDSCEALGAQYKKKNAGRFGDFGVFAFYPNKQITTGEGGLVITDNKSFADKIRALRNQGRAPGDTWLQHTYLGYNYRMDELSAAIGLSQMERIDKLLNNRQRVANWYNSKLNHIPGIEIPFFSPNTTRKSWFVYVIRLAKEFERDKVARELDKEGIPVRPYFLPIHLQPYMVKMFGYKTGDYPITEDLGKRSIALPFSGMMTEGQVDIVCEKLLKCLGV